MRAWLRQHKPDWLYELLPFLYAGSGVLTILVLQNGISLLPGAMLMLAGGSVHAMRKRARVGATKPPATRRDERTQASDLQPSHLMQITLGAANECGHPTIDAQHRDLCATANVLLDAVMTESPPNKVRTLLNELEGDLENHFRTEETILAGIDPQHAEQHKVLHDELLAKARLIIEHCRLGKIDVKEIVDFVAYDFVTEHIAKEDQRYFGKLAKSLR